MMLKGKNKLQINRETLVAILADWLNNELLDNGGEAVDVVSVKVAPTYGADELSLDIEVEPVKDEPEGGE